MRARDVFRGALLLTVAALSLGCVLLCGWLTARRGRGPTEGGGRILNRRGPCGRRERCATGWTAGSDIDSGGGGGGTPVIRVAAAGAGDECREGAGPCHLL